MENITFCIVAFIVLLIKLFSVSIDDETDSIYAYILGQFGTALSS
jgi:hypothetical protein